MPTLPDLSSGRIAGAARRGAARPVGLCLTWHCPLVASGRDGSCQRHRHGGGDLPDGEPLTVAVAGRELPVFLPAWIPAGHTLALLCDHSDGHASLLQDTVTDLAATRRLLTSGPPLPADTLCVGACGQVADLAAATAPLPDGELFERVSRVGVGELTVQRRSLDHTRWAVVQTFHGWHQTLTRAGHWEPAPGAARRSPGRPGRPPTTPALPPPRRWRRPRPRWPRCGNRPAGSRHDDGGDEPAWRA